jgi:hypothetical protein
LARQAEDRKVAMQHAQATVKAERDYLIQVFLNDEATRRTGLQASTYNAAVLEHAIASHFGGVLNMDTLQKAVQLAGKAHVKDSEHPQGGALVYDVAPVVIEKVVEVPKEAKARPMVQMESRRDQISHSARGDREESIAAVKAQHPLDTPEFLNENKLFEQKLNFLISTYQATRMGRTDHTTTAIHKEQLQNIKIMSSAKNAKGEQVPLFKQRYAKAVEMLNKWESDRSKR